MRHASSFLSLLRAPKPKLKSYSQYAVPILFPLQKPLPAPDPPSNLSPKCPRLLLPRRRVQTLSQAAPPLETLSSPGDISIAFESLDSSSSNLDSYTPEELVQAFSLSLRALELFEKDEGGSILVARALRLLGLISRKLKRLDDSLGTLSTAVAVLNRLDKEVVDGSEIRRISIEVEVQLAETCAEMGCKRDTLMSLKRILELRKLMSHDVSREMAVLYKDLAEAYSVVSDFKEALPACLKALGIFEALCGCDSVEVARVRRLLAVVYAGLEENEKALEQNELARGILMGLDLEAELLGLDVESANIRISVGRCGEAIEILKKVIQKVEKESETRASVFVSMARALCSQEKFGESKRCLEIACGVLDKLQGGPSSKVYETYAEISMMHEMMNEFETALSLMSKTLKIVEKLPREQHLEGSISARMGWLLLLTGRADQAIPYLERGEQKLRDSFGQMHFGVGFVNKHLGQAYLEVGKPQEAVVVLETAYNILSRCFGLQHEDSIDACQCLANAYAMKASISPVDMRQRHYVTAMDFQHRVLDAWKSRASDASDELREAHRLFLQLKRKAEGSPSAVFPANALPCHGASDILSHSCDVNAKIKLVALLGARASGFKTQVKMVFCWQHT